MVYNRAIARLRRYEVHALTPRLVKPADVEYPQGLRDLAPPPALLYVCGVVPKGGIAVVGSRTPPASAIPFAYELAKRAHEPIVSGLALGIDAAAHRGALAAGLPTIAYVGYGFGRTYPSQHAELERAIVENGGAVATERRPHAPVAPWALVKRDRLQAAHAWAVVMVASEIDGGAMHTLRFARDLGRRRFALSPPLGAQGDPAWGGNVRALAEGAVALPHDPHEALRIIHAHRRIHIDD